MPAQQTSLPTSRTLNDDIHVFIGYEDYHTGQRAKEALGRSLDLGPSRPRVHTSMWKFDLLQIASLRQYAALEARNADLIWISIHSENELPDAVKNWINQWLGQRRDRECALLISIDGHDEAEQPIPALDHLRRVARDANLDLFAKFLISQEETPTVCRLHQRDPQPADLSPILKRILYENEAGGPSTMDD